MTMCGKCKYYVKRPPEIVAKCTKDGVCLARSKPVNFDTTPDHLTCGTSCVLGVGSVCNSFRRKDKEI